MSCDRPGVIYNESADDGMLLFGCSACGFDMVLGEVALASEVVKAERHHQAGDHKVNGYFERDE